MIQKVGFVIVAGRGAASGQREYQRIGGSIKAQKRAFLDRGVDLSGFHNATLNLKVAAAGFETRHPLFRVKGLQWLRGYPGEDFDLCNCSIEIKTAIYPGLIYYPRPETKGPYAEPAPADVVEVLAPFVRGVTYGMRGFLLVDSAQLRFTGERSKAGLSEFGRVAS